MAKDEKRPKGTKPGKAVPIAAPEKPVEPAPTRRQSISKLFNHQVVGGLTVAMLAAVLVPAITAVGGYVLGSHSADLAFTGDVTATTVSPVTVKGHVNGLGPDDIVWAFNEPDPQPVDDPGTVYPAPGPCVVDDDGGVTCADVTINPDAEGYRYWLAIVDSDEAHDLAPSVYECPNARGDPGPCPLPDGIPGHKVDPVATEIIPYKTH